METSEQIETRWTSEEILRYAARKAVENRNVFSAISTSLFSGETKVLADRDRAYLLQILRQLVFELTYDVKRNLPIRAVESDLDGITLNALASDRSGQVFDLICDTGALNNSDVIEQAVMRLCVFYAGRALRLDNPAHEATSFQVRNGHLCDQLSIPGNSPLRMLLTKGNRDKFGFEDGFNNPFLCSRDLGPETRNQLTWLVAAALRHLISEEMGAVNPSIDVYLEQVISTMTENATSDDPLSSTAVAVALNEAGYLSASSLSAILKNGDFQLFEAGVSQVTGISHRLVRRLIFESGSLCLATLAKALGLSIEDSIHLHGLTTAASQRVFWEPTEDSEEFAKTLSEISSENAATVCTHWRRGQRFQCAIWELNSALNSLA